MAYENNNEFTDWLYNRYVEAMRKGDLMKAFTFSETLREYIARALYQRKFSKQRQHAKELDKMINKALQNSTTHKLLLTGDEGQKEFENTIAEYEKKLREWNFSEEYIREMVIERRFNYGND